LRVFTLPQCGRPALINFGEPGRLDAPGWSDQVVVVDAKYDGVWDIPAFGVVGNPTSVLVRPDGHVAWAGSDGEPELVGSLNRWFGPPS
jgi:3-(3-hydroxy-phenyl)propionate hydroxylase